MNDLLEFLTSREIIVVYVIAGIACLLCVIVYLIEKNNVHLRQKHNTRELNKLVRQVKEEANIEEETVHYDVPVLEPIEEKNETSSVEKLLVDNPPKSETIETKEEPIRDDVIVDSLVIDEMDIVTEVPKEEELEYTSIEPDQETAQLELKKLTEELKRQEAMEEEKEAIALTNYEEQQEEQAIISLEELVRKSKDMYEANELTQYADEGNVPISLQELEQKTGSNIQYEEPFIIENVVPKEENEVKETVDVQNDRVRLDDFQSVHVVLDENVEGSKRFKSSPIISPIFGIEKQDETDLELENTASYEKLDAEIKKTNEFLMTLKDLQKKLD